ncbi:MAG: PQ-loop domain-containing transporter [Ilumatobacteraceae bacterium]
MTLEAVSGTIATMLGIAFIWPQVIRVYSKKSVEGIAPLGTIISIAGTIMWLVYGVATESVPMIFSNTNIEIAFLFLAAYLVRKNALPLWAPFVAFVGTLIFSIVVVRYSVTALGLAGVFIGTPAIFPQFWRAVRTPRLFGVSVVSFTLLATMGTGWFVYGLTIGDPVVSYPNLILVPCSSYIAWKAWRSHHHSMSQRNVTVVEAEPAR